MNVVNYILILFDIIYLVPFLYVQIAEESLDKHAMALVRFSVLITSLNILAAALNIH